jgi:hypothetical protein
VRSDTGWSEHAKLTASDAAADDWFGTAVAVSGDAVTSGAPRDDDGGSSSGSAYVYEDPALQGPIPALSPRGRGLAALLLVVLAAAWLARRRAARAPS